MYILSRVFLFSRFISPVAAVSRDTFLSLFCLPLFAYGVRVKGCTDSSRKCAFREAKRNAKCMQSDERPQLIRRTSERN